MFLPSGALLFIIIMDVLSVTQIDAAFRLPHVPLRKMLEAPEADLFFIYMAVSIIGLTCITIMAWWTMSYAPWTRKMVLEFAELGREKIV